jgi:hypothetical protein
MDFPVFTHVFALPLCVQNWFKLMLGDSFTFMKNFLVLVSKKLIKMVVVSHIVQVKLAIIWF